MEISSWTSRERVVRWAIDLMFFVGVVALTYVGFTLANAKIYQNSAIHSLKAQIQTAAKTDTGRPKPILRIGDVLGRIDIPKLGFSVAILQGTSARVLRLGAGHIEGTSLPGEPGNSGIAGHRDTFFRGIKDIHPDDELELQTATGLSRYQVDWVKVVVPEDTAVLESATGESTLTLVTCYPFYLVGPAPKRFVVHARKE
jgi:sortase A